MAKLLVLINSGPQDGQKARSGLLFARVAQDSGRLDDVKACFFAEGVEILSGENLPNYRKQVDALVERGILIIACQAHAEWKGIADEIRQGAPVDLHYVGGDLVSAIEEGYQIVTF